MQRKLIINSYNKGKSIRDIADKTGFSTRKVRNVLVKNGVTRRTHSEANYLKANPSGDPFSIRKKLTREEETFESNGTRALPDRGKYKT